ncbi:hypothetical protein SAMN06272735_2462 [Streptomyces sp. TLI_55]|uniref:hypothetical protein n=1 Tax=Streptomyces sp. TLI_55 TaxID=1938861 RepID=UPI000BDBBAA9|nr:hypothetical protein [Streptomyces sp. TLI_55]SNX57986.1 hypothetical protein SAMN06272735_2462 [Streptomyces sp. TLI_55]
MSRFRPRSVVTLALSASLLAVGGPVSIANAAPAGCTDAVSAFADGPVSTNTVSPGCGGSTPTPTASPSPSASSTGVPGVTVGDDGWITYSDDATRQFGVTGTVTTVNGTVLSDGTCQFDSSDSGSSSSTTYQQEVGYNPTTCQDRILTGTITPTQEASLASGADTNTVAEVPQSTSSTGDSSAAVGAATTPFNDTGAAEAAASTSYSNAHTKTAWIDPVNITITSLTTNLRWPLYGAGGTLTARNNAYKFKYDGWSTSGTPRPSISSVSGGWGTGGAETFKNNDFEDVVLLLLGPSGWAACGFSTDTAVFKHNVHVYGYRSGARKSTWSDSKAGGCSNLVHHRTSNGYGWTS